jgi:hypothetical protein
MERDELQQLMQERQERLEDALERAEAGEATDEDWSVIRYECGVASVSKSLKTTGANDGFCSERHN